MSTRSGENHPDDASTLDPDHEALGYLNAASAAALDQELMTLPGFTLEQLMELAGLAVAEAVYTVLGPPRSPSPTTSAEPPTPRPRVLLVCGPGNNGGDGLVAARHLQHFGYDCTVVYPNRASNCAKQPHYGNLVQQCLDLQIPVLDALPGDAAYLGDHYMAVVDAIFGFSFQGSPREPFASILKELQEACAAGLLTVAVDIPSGWKVDPDKGDALPAFSPQVLVSLTAPKLCAKNFGGRHLVGGRFLPPALAHKYGIRMPPYPGVAQVMEVNSKRSPRWEEEYAAYLAEKKGPELEADARPEEKTPKGITQALPPRLNENRDPANRHESWELEYAAYLAEQKARKHDS